MQLTAHMSDSDTYRTYIHRVNTAHGIWSMKAEEFNLKNWAETAQSSPAPTDFLSLIFARLFVRALNAASCAMCYIRQTDNNITNSASSTATHFTTWTCKHSTL